MQQYCSICKEPITEDEYNYCIVHFPTPLCKKHQHELSSKYIVELLKKPEFTDTAKSSSKY